MWDESVGNTSGIMEDLVQRVRDAGGWRRVGHWEAARSICRVLMKGHKHAGMQVEARAWPLGRGRGFGEAAMVVGNITRQRHKVKGERGDEDGSNLIWSKISKTCFKEISTERVVKLY